MKVIFRLKPADYLDMEDCINLARNIKNTWDNMKDLDAMVISKDIEVYVADDDSKVEVIFDNAREVEAIPIEQLLSILPKYDDYIHTKTYPYNETMEDIYSKGHEEGWNACLKHIKEELDYWEKENAKAD